MDGNGTEGCVFHFGAPCRVEFTKTP
jgi:hypothetical protein